MPGTIFFFSEFSSLVSITEFKNMVEHLFFRDNSDSSYLFILMAHDGSNKIPREKKKKIETFFYISYYFMLPVFESHFSSDSEKK